MVVSSLTGENLKDIMKWIPALFMYLFVYLQIVSAEPGYVIGVVYNPYCCHVSKRTGCEAKPVFSHMRRVSPLHRSERQGSEVKPIMASKEDVTFIQLSLTRHRLPREQRARGSYSSTAFSLTPRSLCAIPLAWD